MILVDSNVFLIDLRYPRDARADPNGRFLAEIKQRGDGAVSILNLLEILGVASFNLGERQLRTLFRQFGPRYGVTVLPNDEASSLLPCWPVGRLLERLARRLCLGDAMMLEHADTASYRAKILVSWDAPHFRGKTTLQVITPEEFLSNYVQPPS